MEKKVYNQPEVQMSVITSMSIICASITNGGNTSDHGGGGGGEIIGD